MILILVSLFCSALCANIAWLITPNSAMFNYGGIVGLLIPSMIILEKLYKNIKNK